MGGTRRRAGREHRGLRGVCDKCRVTFAGQIRTGPCAKGEDSSSSFPAKSRHISYPSST